MVILNGHIKVIYFINRGNSQFNISIAPVNNSLSPRRLCKPLGAFFVPLSGNSLNPHTAPKIHFQEGFLLKLIARAENNQGCAIKVAGIDPRRNILFRAVAYIR